MTRDVTSSMTRALFGAVAAGGVSFLAAGGAGAQTTADLGFTGTAGAVCTIANPQDGRMVPTVDRTVLSTLTEAGSGARRGRVNVTANAAARLAIARPALTTSPAGFDGSSVAINTFVRYNSVSGANLRGVNIVPTAVSPTVQFDVTVTNGSSSFLDFNSQPATLRGRGGALFDRGNYEVTITVTCTPR